MNIRQALDLIQATISADTADMNCSQEAKRQVLVGRYREARKALMRGRAFPTGYTIGPVEEGDLVTFLEEEKERFEDFARRKQPNMHLNKSDYHAVLSEMRRRQWRWLGAGYGWEPSKLPTKFNPYTGEKKS